MHGSTLRHELRNQKGTSKSIAEVLPENTPMLKVFEKSALPLSKKRESGVVHVTLRLS
jgi:hypothetical protein